MMALCSMELGRNRDAINHIEQALSGGQLPVAQRTALQFDLGRVQRRAGDFAAARHAFNEVQQADARFPGLEAELNALEAVGVGGEDCEADLELGSARNDYESFDDILGDDSDSAAPERESEPETFESFDDVISDAEASDPAPFGRAEPMRDPVPDPELEAELEIEPEPVFTPEVPTDPGTSRPGRRKKKISFV